MRYAALVAAAAISLACQLPDPLAAEPSPSQETARETASLDGTWRITQLNGRPVIGVQSKPEQGPHLQLDRDRISGSTGCNRFGATALVHEDRLFAARLAATERGCDPLYAAQEEAIFRLLRSGPVIQRLSRNVVLLRAAGITLRLNQEAAAPAPEPEERQVMLLAGTRWRLLGADGKWVGAEVGPRLESPLQLLFEADRWTLTASCGTLDGAWRQQGATVKLELDAVPAACRGDPAVNTFAAMARSPIVYVGGPNRQLVIAGNGHFVSGDFDGDFREADAALVAGEWRVQAIDGRPPAESHRAPAVIFGHNAYSVWDGCNRREGIFLTNMGQLFTRDSGTSTLALCPEQASPKIHAVLGGRPRIARTDEGVALVSPAGRLDLVRISNQGFGGQEKTGLRPGMVIDFALESGPARLMLTGDRRFAIQLPCGRLEGDWRPGQPASLSLEPAERHAPNCPAGAGSAVMQLQYFFTGDVQAVIGPNGDYALLVIRDQALSGTVLR